LYLSTKQGKSYNSERTAMLSRSGRLFTLKVVIECIECEKLDAADRQASGLP